MESLEAVAGDRLEAVLDVMDTLSPSCSSSCDETSLLSMLVASSIYFSMTLAFQSYFFLCSCCIVF